MRALLVLSPFLCGLIISSSVATVLTCSGRCGHILVDCSCHTTCVSSLNCCADYSQSCLQVKPQSCSMLGGRALQILGLVLHPGGRLHCSFKDDIDREGFIDAEGHGYCITPLLYETGWIPFAVSTDGAHFNRSGEYLSVHPSRADPAFEIVLLNATQWQYYGTPTTDGELKMKWNSSLISAEKVNIELWGYKESSSKESAETDSSALQAELSYLYSLGRNQPNSGAFSFTPEPSQDYSEWELGNIRITASSDLDGERDVQSLWSRAHVLAWHLAFGDDSSAWARNKCLQWDIMEKNLPIFLDELLDCPCTLAQALADTGRFHTDHSCDTESSCECTHHPGYAHCVKAIQASPTRGSGQQCCYDSSGDLLLSGDFTGGSSSSPHRAHSGGSPPYRVPPRVPGYSHWLYDVVTFYHCCLWSDYCHIYLKHRPSSECRSYQPPRAGVVLGDPHFMTFDGLSYTFNGKGEFSLVSSTHRELSVQARTEQVKVKNGTLAKATRLSSVAMKEKASDIIEVRLAEDRLEVLRNQEVLSFTEQTWMDLHGVSVFAPSLLNVTVMLLSGAGVEVRVHEGTMAVTVLLPSEFINQTKGLLGLMNSDPSDDLLTQAGEVIPIASVTPEDVFTFGAGWNISKESSLFTYDSKYLLETYYFTSSNDPAFVPALSPPERPDDPLMADVLMMCSGEGADFCKYDTLTTQSLTMGNATLRAYQNHRALLKALEPVVSCGWLPTPRNGEKNGTNYLEGITLGFSCREGYTLFGSTERTCLHDGTWTGDQPQCVKDDNVGFVLGALGFSSALVTMGVMIKLHNRKQDREKKERLEQKATQEPAC